MKSALNKAQVDYIFFHLNQNHFDTLPIADRIVYQKPAGGSKLPHIIFPASGRGISPEFRIDSTAVLYPCSDAKRWYELDSRGNLVFHHDILKAAFYLLSGYAETTPYNGDHLERFSFKDSILSRFYDYAYPLVNRYFEIIEQAVEVFCKANKLPFSKRTPWQGKNFGLMLTHDVDRVDRWTLGEVHRRGMHFFKRPRLQTLKEANRAAINYLFKRNNFYWNFDWLKTLEQKYGFPSTWYLLPRGHKTIDAHYSLHEPRIVNLIKTLRHAEDEIALHGTYYSRKDFTVMQSNLRELEKVAQSPIAGIRQHWLSFEYPRTLLHQQKLGFRHDSSWAFADVIGWRNGYCMPFKPFDFERNAMMNLWEFPLCLMDRTLFDYMKLDAEKALKRVKQLLSDCEKYRGLFVLLWHNSFFDDSAYPGVTWLYLETLKLLHNKGPLAFTPGAFLEHYGTAGEKNA